MAVGDEVLQRRAAAEFRMASAAEARLSFCAELELRSFLGEPLPWSELRLPPEVSEDLLKLVRVAETRVPLRGFAGALWPC
mmetsp:Transcript_12133/g.37992  ORF Transcript_12133/g.37992 Transcript_12133/m.37992 type:complete len:81 (-) Transcript_12133:186-428(-)